MKEVTKIDMQTVMSQNYVAADYFDGFEKIAAATTAKGYCYFFGLNSTNQIWMAVPQDDEETGFTPVDTGIVADRFAVSPGDGEQIVIVYAKGLSVYFRTVIGKAVSAEKKLHAVAPTGSQNVSGLKLYKRDYVLYIGIMFSTQTQGSSQLSVGEMILPECSCHVVNTAFVVTGENFGWIRDNLDAKFMTVTKEALSCYSATEKNVITYPSHYPGSPVSSTTANGQHLCDAVLSLSSTGKCYAFDFADTTWKEVNVILNATPKHINAVSYRGKLHIFLIGEKDGVSKMYHAEHPIGTTVWSLADSLMLPLSGPVKGFFINKAEQRRLRVIFDRDDNANKDEAASPFGFLAAERAVEYITLDESEYWQCGRAIADTKSDNVYEYRAFVSEAVFYQEKNIVYPDLQVRVTTDAATELVINNTTYFVSPRKAVTVKTNALGKLAFIQKANDFNAVEVNIELLDGTNKQYKIASSKESVGVLRDGQISHLMK